MNKRMDVFENQELLLQQQFFNTVSYLPFDKLSDIPNKEKISKVLKKAELEIPKMKDGPAKEEAKSTLRALQTMITQHPELELDKAIIHDMSWKDNDQDNKPDYPIKGMQACAFSTSNGDTFVAFRGTPAGSWVDNAKMLLGSLLYSEKFVDREGRTWNYLSSMQEDGMRYMEGLLEKHKGEWMSGDGKRYLTGHSKGGNLAFLAMLLYGKYFDAAISMDAPNFSNEQVAEIQEHLSESQRERILGRSYSINASDDFVSPLGKSIFLSENTRWFQAFRSKGDILANHYITSFYNFDTGELAMLDATRGAFGNFVNAISEESMGLNTSQREASYLFLMMAAQFAQGKEWPVETGYGEALDLSVISVPGFIIATVMIHKVFESEVGKEFVIFLDKEEILDELKSMLDRWFLVNFLGFLYQTPLVLLIQIFILTTIIRIVQLWFLTLIVDYAVELLVSLGEKVKELFDITSFILSKFVTKDFMEDVIRFIRKEIAVIIQMWEALVTPPGRLEVLKVAEIERLKDVDNRAEFRLREGMDMRYFGHMERRMEELDFSGRIGFHEDSMAETCRIMDAIHHTIESRIRSKLDSVIELLEGGRFHTVSVQEIRDCREKILERDQKLMEYKEALMAYQAECQDIATKMLTMIKGGEIGVTLI